MKLKPGLVYFWALNDACRDETIDRFVDAFAAQNASAVVLHPRAGLMLPYGGDDWFAFIRRTVDRCASRELNVWLYDEDPYPSGAAGGWVMFEHPEYEARGIEIFKADAALREGELFTFPAGKLLWCGLVDSRTRQTVDLTSRVGVVRQQWHLLDPWDSRWYYPATPVYPCARSEAMETQFALRAPRVPGGSELLAFVARPAGRGSHWGALPDSLNPLATREFIRRTHEPYLQTVGHHFGKTITAIFTDEAKFFSRHPFTDGLLESFRESFGYDLRPRLNDLFSDSENPEAMLTRLHYRQWCARRFEEAWVEPVSRWCREHGLPLVGHISPEDDPVQQIGCVGNLMPLHRHFDLPGLDLIIPAVGDEHHPLINIGVLGATSAAQQMNKPGVMSESLGASGLDLTVDRARQILAWQSVMGMTCPVIHAAFNSTEGMRLHDAPPDFGPDSPRWNGMPAIAEALKPIQRLVVGATQIAPVAILWPIRSFAAAVFADYTHDSPLRDEFVRLVQLCLDRQVGVHLLDEAALAEADIEARHIRLGRADYSHVLIPSTVVLADQTIRRLHAAHQQGVSVHIAGRAPLWQQTDHGLTPAAMTWCPRADPTTAVRDLPRLLNIEQDERVDLRCTVWEKNSQRVALLLNLSAGPIEIEIDGEATTLEPHMPLIHPIGVAAAAV